MFIERNGCAVAVGSAGVGVSATCVGAGAVVTTAGAQELLTRTTKINKYKWDGFILPPNFSKVISQSEFYGQVIKNRFRKIDDPLKLA
jgi:hypothetical protein